MRRSATFLAAGKNLQLSQSLQRTLCSAGLCLAVSLPVSPSFAETGSTTSKASSSREVSCLAEAIYFEARGESVIGQEAVAQVVLNRVGKGRFPPSICGVVYQGQNRRTGCQFSFACDGKADARNEKQAWEKAQQIARDMAGGRKRVASLETATHYHATHVRPRWAKAMRRLSQIGNHVFYEE